MCTYFKTETDVAQNLIDDFFQTLTVRGPFQKKKKKKKGGYGINFLKKKKKKALYAELNKRVEAATSSYSATGEFLQYIYSVLVVKNHQKIWSRYLFNEFSITDIF